MSNNDSKCMRFSYLLELYRLSSCGPSLEIFERFRILHPDLTYLVLKSGSLIWALDIFAIAFRIYPKGPLIPSLYGFFRSLVTANNISGTQCT